MDILEIIERIFRLWNYPEQRTEEGRRECQKLIRGRAKGLMILTSIVFILSIIFCVYFGTETTFNMKVKEIMLGWKDVTLSDLLWICMGACSILSLATFVYALGVYNHWKLRESSEFVDIRYIQKLFNERYELDNRRCSECDKYSHTGKLIVKALENRSHEKFISFFKDATRLNPEALNLIKEDFKREPKYAKLLCVLSNPQYFTPETNIIQLEQLTHYFISFYPYINDQKRIKRIFSLSAIGAIGEKREPIYHEKAKWLFQYLLINYITGVETCLLVDEEGLKIHVDYVVGKYPEGEYRLYSKRKSYFSYEVENEKDKDYTIQSSDQLFTNILETDFYERWKGLKSDNKERDRIYVKGNWERITKKLQLSEEDIKLMFVSLSNHICSCKDGYITLQDKNALFEELQNIIQDKSIRMDKHDKHELIKKIKEIKGIE